MGKKIGELEIRYNRSDGWWYVLSPKNLQHSIGMFSHEKDAVEFCEDLNRKKLRKEKRNGKSLSQS